MKNEKKITNKPLILAPSGCKESFLAAISAGADAVYCGLKKFSARMEAKNFSLNELIPLVNYAHKKSIKVYIALNTLIKQNEFDELFKTLKNLNSFVKPDAFIIQDLGMIQVLKNINYRGQIHLSTLANVSFPYSLNQIKKLGISHVVLPRELSLNEIKKMNNQCNGISLEIFVYGALCYGISGRCYWSSFLGGKSGLRGRCVQPCRRIYKYKNNFNRYFSCLDLNLSPYISELITLQNIKTWKIEGRKKGPHYVYNTVKAFKLLRDYGNREDIINTANELLKKSLSRKSQSYFFNVNNIQSPLNHNGDTGSGLIIGNVITSNNKFYFSPNIKLYKDDILRLGYEDKPGHGIHFVKKNVQEKEKYELRLASGKHPEKGAPIFLIDRQEIVKQEINIINREIEYKNINIANKKNSKDFLSQNTFVTKKKKNIKPGHIHVFRKSGNFKMNNDSGTWISLDSYKQFSKKINSMIWWLLPPVIWPEHEKLWLNLIRKTIKSGGKKFIINSVWQISLFENPDKFEIWAGPFCNISNTFSIKLLSNMGFKGVFLSPELSKKDYLQIGSLSPLPLGLAIYGFFPLSISKILSNNLKPFDFFTSPKGEDTWISKYDYNYWIFPNWKLDLRKNINMLTKANFSKFLYLNEPFPDKIPIKKRPGKWNWDLELL